MACRVGNRTEKKFLFFLGRFIPHSSIQEMFVELLLCTKHCEDTVMTEKDTVPMLRGISADADPGLWRWTLPDTPEKVGNGPARALLINTDGAPKSALTSPGGALQVLLLSIAVLPGHQHWSLMVLLWHQGWALMPALVLSMTSVMRPGRDPSLLLLKISVHPFRLPCPSQLELLQADGPQNDSAACDVTWWWLPHRLPGWQGWLPNWRLIDPLAWDSL